MRMAVQFDLDPLAGIRDRWVGNALGKLGADLCGVDVLGFGEVEFGEDVERLLPMPAGLLVAADGAVGLGEAVVGTSLVVGLVEVAGEVERGLVVCERRVVHAAGA